MVNYACRALSSETLMAPLRAQAIQMVKVNLHLLVQFSRSDSSLSSHNSKG